MIFVILSQFTTIMMYLHIFKYILYHGTPRKLLFLEDINEIPKCVKKLKRKKIFIFNHTIIFINFIHFLRG